VSEWEEEREYLFRKFQRHLWWLHKADATLLKAIEQGGTPSSIDRPSELLRLVGNLALFLPQFWEAIHDRVQRAAHPLGVIHPGATIEVDERKDLEFVREARTELRRVFRQLLVANPGERRKPRTFWRERMLDRYEQLIKGGTLRKKALRVVTKEENLRRERSHAVGSAMPPKHLNEATTEAYLSKARRARERAGKQVLRSRSRTLLRKKV
jgi:hypothetical protein